MRKKRFDYIPATEFMPKKVREYRVRQNNILTADLYIKADTMFVNGDFVVLQMAGQTVAVIQTNTVDYIIAEDDMEVDG